MKNLSFWKTIFKFLILQYFDFFKTIKSISLIKKSSTLSRFDLRIRILINNKFLLHSLGINYTKNLFKKYIKNIDLFESDIKNNDLDFDQIWMDIKGNKKDIFLKKLNAVFHFIKLSLLDKNLNFFKYFKIKPERTSDGTYSKSSLIIASKLFENNAVVLYCIPSSLFEYKHIQSKKYFYNSDKTIINTTFLPISIKYKKIKNEEFKSFQRIDLNFLNKKSGLVPL